MRNTHVFVATLVMLALLVISSVMQIAKLDHAREDSAHQEGTEARSSRLKSRVKKVCRDLNISSPITDFHLSNILVDEETMTLYCSIPKVASTTMKKVFLRLTGVFSIHQFNNFKDRSC
ncbi:carbohydrate sulfotransferase 10-like [Penaeus japonicus]|uniref:carbohydrate sulfotransferase 10-like n=1 Tax=Penaeus japonicus TaxID=27405 RepID=UPI001C710EE7|nr:carbohydrate sulfotransferase 10-like [Penaeus japonicus]